MARHLCRHGREIVVHLMAFCKGLYQIMNHVKQENALSTYHGMAYEFNVCRGSKFSEGIWVPVCGSRKRKNIPVRKS